MLMTQQSIKEHYEQEWKTRDNAAHSLDQLGYCSPVEQSIILPVYRRLLRDAGVSLRGRRVLDVGSGSGRWVRFFLESFEPESVTAMDYTRASVELLERWFSKHPAQSTLRVCHASITDTTLDLGQRFDLINIANVLFHIPEDELFQQALVNCRKHLSEDGVIVTTEYLPRVSVRTNWMMVRSRHEFESRCTEAGLRVRAIRASGFFNNDPMGLDAPDEQVRKHFELVRARSNQLLRQVTEPAANRFILELLCDIERATLGFLEHRMAAVELPTQKLVLLEAA